MAQIKLFCRLEGGKLFWNSFVNCKHTKMCLAKMFHKTLYKYASICFSPVNFLDVNKSHLAGGGRINKTLNFRALYNNS